MSSGGCAKKCHYSGNPVGVPKVARGVPRAGDRVLVSAQKEGALTDSHLSRILKRGIFNSHENPLEQRF